MGQHATAPEVTPAVAFGGGEVEVVERRALAAGVVVEFSLARPDRSRLPDWAPGAHIDLVLPDGAVRQYSLCGDRWEAEIYRIAVARDEGGRGGSMALHDSVRIGDLLGFGGPRNNFRLSPAADYLFVAAGIGITPFLPMIQQAEMLGVPWRMLYLGRSRDRLAYLDALKAYGDRVHVHCGDELGRASLDDWIPSQSSTRVYACGPERLLDAVEAWPIVGDGLAARIERFTATRSAGATDATSFEVVAARSGIAVQVQPRQSIVAALHSAGIQVLTSCAQGVCGTCETDVLDGVADHRDSLLDDRERTENTCIFPCVSRCVGERLVLDL